MEIVAVIAVLLLLIAVPAIVVNRDLLFHRSAARRTAAEVPLPFLIIPSFPGAANIVPAGVARNHTAATPTQPAQQARAPKSSPKSSPISPQKPQPQPAAPSQWADRAVDVADDMYAPMQDEDEYEVEHELEHELEHEAEREVTSERTHGIANEAGGAIDTDSEETSPDATIVFNRPVDEPVQILPGRLRILSGEDAGEDLRLFSRIGEQPQIVVGRDTGPAHRHITLHSPTVSRRHARMDFADGRWTITNLSTTNPVVVNDRALANGGSARKLSDGDRIELGEVALRFMTS
jgi:hypothetical protein